MINPIDGGMSANDWMAQDLADMLTIDVERPAFVETTALGAAMLAAVGCGLFPSLEDAASMRGGVTRFAPMLDNDARASRLAGWADALARVLSFERQFRVGYAEAFSTPRRALRDHCRTHLLCFFG